jgi:hypothetical protein
MFGASTAFHSRAIASRACSTCALFMAKSGRPDFAWGDGGVSTALHSLAPQGRGWGEGVTMFPYRAAGAPSSHLLPAGEKE